MSEETQTTEEVKEPSYYFAEGVAGRGVGRGDRNGCGGSGLCAGRG